MIKKIMLKTKTTKSTQGFAKIGNQTNLIIFWQTPGWASKEAPPLQQDSSHCPLGHFIKLLRCIPGIITLKWLHKRLKKVILKKSFHCYSSLLSWEGISCIFLQGLGFTLVLTKYFHYCKIWQWNTSGRGWNHSKDKIKIKGILEEPISEHFYSKRKCYF